MTILSSKLLWKRPKANSIFLSNFKYFSGSLSQVRSLSLKMLTSPFNNHPEGGGRWGGCSTTPKIFKKTIFYKFYSKNKLVPIVSQCNKLKLPIKYKKLCISWKLLICFNIIFRQKSKKTQKSRKNGKIYFECSTTLWILKVCENASRIWRCWVLFFYDRTTIIRLDNFEIWGSGKIFTQTCGFLKFAEFNYY